MSFRTPLAAHHVALTGDGSAMLLVEERTPAVVESTSPTMRLWTSRFGPTVLPFVSQDIVPGGGPVLAVDSRGHHWIAWMEARRGPVTSGRVLMLQDVGPGGTDVQAPEEVPSCSTADPGSRR